MSKLQLLTIGYIPEKHPGGLIMCGDPTSSGTQELTLNILNDVIRSDEILQLKIDGRKLDWFSPDGTLWHSLSSTINAHLKCSKKIHASSLLALWSQLMDEPITSSEDIIELPDEYGEFYNVGQQFNQKFYFRFQEVEDNKYLSDQIFILNHD